MILGRVGRVVPVAMPMVIVGVVVLVTSRLVDVSRNVTGEAEVQVSLDTRHQQHHPQQQREQQGAQLAARESRPQRGRHGLQP